MPERSERPDFDLLRNKIIGLGERSIRKSYYPELQCHVEELERVNRELVAERDKLRRAIESVEENEAKFRNLFHSMTEGMVIHELVFDGEGNPADYRFLDCNDAYVRLLGMSQTRILGQLGSDIFGVNPPPRIAEFSSVNRTGTPQVLSGYSPYMNIYYTASVVSQGQNRVGMIITDITDLEKSRRLIAEKNRELENYLYVASHDLRAPLVNIQGFSTRLKKQADQIGTVLQSGKDCDVKNELLAPLLTGAIPRTLEFIFLNVARMDRLINALLELLRTGRLSMCIRRIDIGRLINGISDSLAFQIEQAGAEVSVGNLAACYGDENLLARLFTNILGNALRYRHPERRLKISVSSESLPRLVIYRISDNGMGIAQRDLDRIWDVFYRGTSAGEISGEGVGLSIVKRIAEKHNGRVWVESVEGSGSTFFVELPAEAFEETGEGLI